MARMYPLLTESQLRDLPSQAEAIVYRCLRDALDNSYLVLHGKPFIAPRKDGSHIDGEADFIIFSAKHGLLIIEVKGGGVSYDPETGWRSIDRFGNSHVIKSPVEQAKNQKYTILDQLKSNQMWAKLNKRITFGHAVLFPDLKSINTVQFPDCPIDIIGGKAVLTKVADWIDKIYNFWEGKNHTPLGDEGLRAVEQIFCHAIEVRPLLRDTLELDEKLRIKLTNEQASILRTLVRHKRAAIVGPAGTGKTILAMEKTRMLSSEESDVLMLCYNKALAVYMRQHFKQNKGVLVCTFHQFCEYCIRLLMKEGISDPLKKAKRIMPNEDYFDTQLPLAAFYAIEELGEALQFDAIVVDEGQDFGEEYWLPIEMALRSSEDSCLYVFYDENQKVYSRVSSFPIPEHDTFLLTRNCRNSKPVHDLAYSYYVGEPADYSGIDGMSPITLESPSTQSQAKQIARLLKKLLYDEKIAPESIAVLVSGPQKEDLYSLLKTESLPKPAKWSREEHFRENSVLMDTIKRFKGLERDVIILWINQSVVANEALMYVGSSRAKSILYLVGDRASINAVKLNLK